MMHYIGKFPLDFTCRFIPEWESAFQTCLHTGQVVRFRTLAFLVQGVLSGEAKRPLAMYL